MKKHNDLTVAHSKPPASGRWLGVALAWLVAAGPVLAAGQDRDAIVRNDREVVEAGGAWVYNDLERGRAVARESGKPLLVVFRCPP